MLKMLKPIAISRFERFYPFKSVKDGNFNQKKETGVKQVSIGDKLLYEGVV